MEQTLLLNATYEPLRVVHWQKAITLWCQGKVEIVAHYDREIRSVSFSMRLPSVIRLLLVRPGQAEDVLGQVVQDHLLRDRGDLE
jgi:5-methylcytosine-specific restriction endonuclease McrA